MCYNNGMNAKGIFLGALKGTGQVVGAVGMIAIGLIKALAFTATGVAMGGPDASTPIHAIAAASVAADKAATKTAPTEHKQTAQELGQTQEAEGPKLLSALMGVSSGMDMGVFDGEII
jgi:hypothetical protein